MFVLSSLKSATPGLRRKRGPLVRSATVDAYTGDRQPDIHDFSISQNLQGDVDYMRPN
jgi:hypothetical protein